MNQPNGNEDPMADWEDEFAAESEQDPREIAENRLKQTIKDDKENPFLKLAVFVNPLKEKQYLVDDINENARLANREINDKEKSQITDLEKDNINLKKKIAKVLLEYKSKYLEFENLTVADAEIIAAVYTKEVFGQLYYNFDYIRSGQEPQKQELGELLLEGDEIFSRFEKLEGKRDIFKVLQEYQKTKEAAADNNDPEAVKLFIFWDVKNEELENLIIKLEELSDKFGKDIIKSVVDRRQIEKRITELEKEIASYKIKDKETDQKSDVRDNYATAQDQIQQLLSSYKDLEPIMGSSRKAMNSLSILKEHVDTIIEFELAQIENDKFEYEDMTPKKKKELKQKYEKILNLEVSQLFNLDTLAFLGEHVENRFKKISQLADEHTQKNQIYRRDYL